MRSSAHAVVRCLKRVWKVSGRCLEGVWKVTGSFLEGVWEVTGRCLEGLSVLMFTDIGAKQELLRGKQASPPQEQEFQRVQ